MPQKYTKEQAEWYYKKYGEYPYKYEPKEERTESAAHLEFLEKKKSRKRLEEVGVQPTTLDSLKWGLKKVPTPRAEGSEYGATPWWMKPEVKETPEAKKASEKATKPAEEFGKPPWYLSPEWINKKSGKTALNRQLKGMSDEERIKFWSNEQSKTFDPFGRVIESMRTLHDTAKEEIEKLIDKSTTNIPSIPEGAVKVGTSKSSGKPVYRLPDGTLLEE